MTLQEQYNLIKKGKGHKGVFLNEAKLRYPNLLRPAATYEEAVKTLNSKNIIKENIYYPQVLGNEGGTQKEPWELKFRSFLNEEEENIKADIKKTDKSVEDALANAYDNTDVDNLDNQIGQEVMNGIYFEAKQNPDKTLDEIRKIVSKNLAKDKLFYVKNGQFGMEGVGYETQKSDEASGKSASSGYGEKTVDKKEPKELQESLEEGNPTFEIAMEGLLVLAVLFQIYTKSVKGVKGWWELFKKKRELNKYPKSMHAAILKIVKDPELIAAAKEKIKGPRGGNISQYKQDDVFKEILKQKLTPEEYSSLTTSMKGKYSNYTKTYNSQADTKSWDEKGLADLDENFLIKEGFRDGRLEPGRDYEPEVDRGETNTNFSDDYEDDDMTEGLDLYATDDEGEPILDIEKIVNAIKSSPRFEELKEYPNWMALLDDYLNELDRGFSPGDGYENVSDDDLINDVLEYMKYSGDEDDEEEGEPLNESEDEGQEEFDAEDDADYELDNEDYPGKDDEQIWQDQNYGFTDDDEVDESKEKEEPKKTTKVKKETLETRLAAIEREGAAVTLEAKIQHLQTEMDTKNERLSMIGENQDLADLVDGKKLKEMQREIKVLGKRNDKLKKIYEKMTGKAYVQQEIVDENAEETPESSEQRKAGEDFKNKPKTPQPGVKQQPVNERRLFRRK